MGEINNFGNTPGTFHQSLISHTQFGVFGFQHKVLFAVSGEQFVGFKRASKPWKAYSFRWHAKTEIKILRLIMFQAVRERYSKTALKKNTPSGVTEIIREAGHPNS